MKVRRVLVSLATLAVASAAVFVAGCAEQAATTDAASPAATASPDVAASPAGGGHEGHAMGGNGSGAAHAGHTMGTTGLDALKPLKGKEFDVAFLSQMIAHHAAAVKMAKDAEAGAATAETKADARAVIEAQTKEIAQMTRWLKDWYGTAPDPAQQALVNKDMAEMMSMSARSDQMFYGMMIPHHQGAIDMSKLVPERSERAEVKKLAVEIIAAQEKEIQAYRARLGTMGKM
jgi:uncharacterized protein (DUF305 family)